MRLSHTLEYYGLVSIAWLLCLLPQGLALGIGACFGRFAWFVGIRKSLILSNLKHALPDASEEELKRVGLRASLNFGRTVTEFIRFRGKDPSQFHEWVHFEGKELVLAALEKGNGALLLTGHLGSWAIYFAALSHEGVPLALLVGKQHNERVDSFIHSLSADEVELISKGKPAIRKILQNLKAGRAVVMVADQHAGSSGIMTPFMGEETPTMALPGAFAVKHNVPVFTLMGRRDEKGRHHVVIEPLETLPCEGYEERRDEILRAYNEVLGKAIKRNPEQYFWYHRRWRKSDRKLSEKAEESF